MWCPPLSLFLEDVALQTEPSVDDELKVRLDTPVDDDLALQAAAAQKADADSHGSDSGERSKRKRRSVSSTSESQGKPGAAKVRKPTHTVRRVRDVTSSEKSRSNSQC